MNTQKSLFVNVFLFLSLLLLSINVFSQNYYETEYENLKDTIFYPKIDKDIKSGNFEEILNLADSAYDFYYEKGEKDRALYLYNLCIYFPAGYGLAKKAVSKMEHKLYFLRLNTDTANVHFASSLFVLAQANIRMFALEKARPIFDNAISLLEKCSDTPPLHLYSAYKATAFLNAYLFQNKRSFQLAKLALNGFKSIYTKDFSKGKRTQVTYDIAYTYMTFAVLMKQTGQIELSLSFNKNAVEVFKTLPTGKENTAILYNNIADNCIVLGDFDKALNYSEKADSIIKAENFQKKLKTSYIAILSNKGKALMNLNRYSEADKSFRKLVKFMDAEFKPKEAVKADGYNNIAENFKRQNKLDSAMFYYLKAQNYNPKNKETTYSLAEMSAKSGDFKKAISFSKKYISYFVKNKDKSQNSFLKADDFEDNQTAYKAVYESAKYYFSLYEKNKNKEDLEKCIHYSALADTLINRHRNSAMIGANDIKLATDYHDIANIGIKANYEIYKNSQTDVSLDEILNYIFQSTAFKLNAEVKQVEMYSGNSTKQLKLLQEIRNLENKKLALKNKPDKTQEKIIDNKLFESRFKALELSFDLQNNENNTLSKDLFEPIKYIQIRNNLKQNEAVIAYFIGNDTLYSALITNDNLKINTTRAGSDFENTLKQYYKSLKTGSFQLKNHASEMYSYLISDIENDIKNIKHLIIIPDGELAQIPFESLVYNKTGKSKYLIEKMAVSYNYSIFLWLRSNKLQKNEAVSFVGFAPVFMKKNNIITESNPLEYDKQLCSEYSGIRDGNDLKPLPYSEKEVENINMLFVADKKKSRIFTYKDANEENFKANISGYSIVHIATHGFSSKKDPELSGLFFDQNNNGKKDLTNDGFVYVGEVFTLKPKANLVVLSACKTGVGKITKGEGVLALPRAFIFAGVPNLVVSLWKIQDEKTENMMIDFYKNILSGKSYSEALRQAKLKQIKNGELPIDWSSMILIGE